MAGRASPLRHARANVFLLAGSLGTWWGRGMRKRIVGLSSLLLPLIVWAAPEGKHLFILSGQSNMAGLDPLH